MRRCLRSTSSASTDPRNSANFAAVTVNCWAWHCRTLRSSWLASLISFSDRPAKYRVVLRVAFGPLALHEYVGGAGVERIVTHGDQRLLNFRVAKTLGPVVEIVDLDSFARRSEEHTSELQSH